jgi:hypothetical protein
MSQLLSPYAAMRRYIVDQHAVRCYIAGENRIERARVLRDSPAAALSPPEGRS